jgi:hypothetical protein
MVFFHFLDIYDNELFRPGDKHFFFECRWVRFPRDTFRYTNYCGDFFDTIAPF